jgi:predicted O-linked N-acetylglucosamine transferase (SPINDLY family)
VFCNFNACYKLTPSSFAGWMRIMRQVPSSVLWLLEGDPHFLANVRGHAEAQGIAGDRIIMAPFLPPGSHLARLSLADLLLDSLPYNAHTTASDALWAGVPMITRRGTSFAGRVGASLLKAIGLPELVTETSSDYESLAVTLAKDATLLNSFRNRLALNRNTAPLFDTVRFARHLEMAFETMFEVNQRGEKPKVLEIGSS